MNIRRHPDSYGENSRWRSLGSATVCSARADMVGNFSTLCASVFSHCAAAKRRAPAIDCPNGTADDVRESAGQPPPPPSLPGSGHQWVRIGAIATDRGGSRGDVKRSGAGFLCSVSAREGESQKKIADSALQEPQAAIQCTTLNQSAFRKASYGRVEWQSFARRGAGIRRDPVPGCD